VNDGASIHVVPDQAAVRTAVRAAAAAAVAEDPQGGLGDRARLEQLGMEVLKRLGLPATHLGYAMVSCSNAAWRGAFAAVPASRRLLLLPHCLRDAAGCRAQTDAAGLHCAACGACDIPSLSQRAESLGYRVVVAEGTSAIAEDIIERGRDAVLGVACMESLERSFDRVAAIGLPHVAVPLLRDGCRDTDCDREELESFLVASATPQSFQHRSFLPLLRSASRLTAPDRLIELLGPVLPGEDGAHAVEALSRDWLAAGGKRLRAFCTLAAYGARRHGEAAFTADADVDALVPVPIRRLALAIEAMHKASLVHDDIQDDAGQRYGRVVPHRSHGVALAINLGDHLLGLGYHLISSLRVDLGPEAVNDIMSELSEAHRELCLGQGAELLARKRWPALNPVEVLAIAGRKTAPAFAAALFAGLRAAGPVSCQDDLLRFTRYLGECYQVLDDLDDWAEDDSTGEDLRLRQPTILAAFAHQAGQGEALLAASGKPDAVEQARAIYERCGAFAQARTLADRLRTRALDAAQTLPGEAVRELMSFLIRTATSPRD
jgi:geranylgeranyl pyrophosphate synthase